MQSLKNKNYKNLNLLIQFLFFIPFMSVMLFNRSFIGLYIFGFRLGELSYRSWLIYSNYIFNSSKK